MDILLMIHSIVRWLIVGVGFIVLVKFLIGWLGNGRFAKLDRRLISSFNGLIDLQVTLGLFFLLWSGLSGAGFPRHRIEHAVTMIAVVIVTHLPVRRKGTTDKAKFRNSFLVIVVTAVLIFAGVASLPGGWTR